MSDKKARLRLVAGELKSLGYDDASWLTPVVAATEPAPLRVHAAVSAGSFDSYPLCGALANRDRETTDRLANCPDCKTVCRMARIDLCGLFDGIGEDYDPDAEKWDRYAM